MPCSVSFRGGTFAYTRAAVTGQISKVCNETTSESHIPNVGQTSPTSWPSSEPITATAMLPRPARGTRNSANGSATRENDKKAECGWDEVVMVMNRSLKLTVFGSVGRFETVYTVYT